MYNVTFRRVRTIIVAVEKQWVLHIVSVSICSLKYAACNAHASRCHLWPAPLYNFFPHSFIKDTIFEKKKLLYTKKCVLISSNSTTFVWKISHSRNNEQGMIKSVYWSSCTLYSCPFSWILNFLNNFSKNLKYQISWKSVKWEPSCFMRTDRRTDMTKLIVAFRNFANAPKNSTVRLATWPSWRCRRAWNIRSAHS
jgi:hypothetical protein